MRTLYFDCQRPIDSKLLDPSASDKLGSGAVSINRRFNKPMREFSLRPWDQMLDDQMQILRNEIHANRISGVFYFDGDKWGDITEPIFIAEGNGSQKEYPMPYDNILAPSWKIWVSGILNTGWTIYEQAGIIVFATAPTGRITGTGKRKFRVILQESSESILQESQIYSNSTDAVYTVSPVTLLEVEATDIA